ncbi:MAG: DUF11 domain-containing protein [bacterium]|nr:DUF11 domain-containing protein [bacterium]
MRDFLKKVASFAKSHPVFLGVTLVALVAGARVLAWGPGRATFTMAKPADYVTFNSITDNPNIGDERDFVGIREKGTQNAWSNKVQIQDGKEYYIRMYVHNNAAANLNLVAENVTAKLNVPNKTDTSITVDGQISASNANPAQVWDNATFTSDKKFNLTYVSGSALYENNSVGARGGVKLSDNLLTNTGALLGYDKLDGKIPGCNQYAGYVTVLVKAKTVEESNISISKTVRNKTNGDKTWNEVVDAKPGDTVQFQIDAKNTGNSQINNLVIRDILPKGLKFVPGSAKLYNANNGFKGSSIDDSVIAKTEADKGANVGAYSAGSNAVVRFDATVVENDQLPKCGENLLTNLAQASDQRIAKNDTAGVRVKKECKTVAYKCDALSVKLISKKEISNGSHKGAEFTYEFDTAYTAQNTTFKGVKYVVKNSKGEVVAEKTVNNGTKLTFTASLYASDTFNVTATVLTADGENTNANCAKSFELNVPQTKALKCESIVISRISRTKFEISTNITKVNVSNVNVNYVIKNSKGETVRTFENDGSKTQIEITQSGDYTITATVKGDGVNSSDCSKQFTVPKENTPSIVIEKTVNGVKDLKVEANTDFPYEITVRNNGSVDLKEVKVTDKAPANVKFISSDKGEIKDNVLTYTIPSLKVGESQTIKITAQATATNMKAKNVACVDTPTIPGDNDGCDSANIEVPPKSTPTPPPTTPEVPAELPKTGFDSFGAMIALGSLASAGAAYIASRRMI